MSAPGHLQIINIKLSENKTLGTKNCETGLRRHQDWTESPPAFSTLRTFPPPCVEGGTAISFRTAGAPQCLKSLGPASPPRPKLPLSGPPCREVQVTPHSLQVRPDCPAPAGGAVPGHPTASPIDYLPPKRGRSHTTLRCPRGHSLGIHSRRRGQWVDNVNAVKP